MTRDLAVEICYSSGGNFLYTGILDSKWLYRPYNIRTAFRRLAPEGDNYGSSKRDYTNRLYSVGLATHNT
jgi:hypothetical protein